MKTLLSSFQADGGRTSWRKRPMWAGKGVVFVGYDFYGGGARQEHIRKFEAAKRPVIPMGRGAGSAGGFTKHERRLSAGRFESDR